MQHLHSGQHLACASPKVAESVNSAENYFQCLPDSLKSADEELHWEEGSVSAGCRKTHLHLVNFPLTDPGRLPLLL